MYSRVDSDGSLPVAGSSSGCNGHQEGAKEKNAWLCSHVLFVEDTMTTVLATVVQLWRKELVGYWNQCLDVDNG